VASKTRIRKPIFISLLLVATLALRAFWPLDSDRFLIPQDNTVAGTPHIAALSREETGWVLRSAPVLILIFTLIAHKLIVSVRLRRRAWAR